MNMPSFASPEWHTAILLILFLAKASALPHATSNHNGGRERVSLNADWRFWRSESIPDDIIYDLRPDANNDTLHILKSWILPSANNFIDDPDDRHERPSDEPKIDIPFSHNTFDDADWETVRLPHDWAIAGPFYTGEDPPISSGMGRLPVHGVGWYRRKLNVSAEDLDKAIFLEVDGAMSYPMVWVNGRLAGGWAYGYNSFYIEITPLLAPGSENQLAIRVENPSGSSSRWYPGAGIYRNVWLTKVNPTHVAHWGTYITTSNITSEKATIHLEVQVENAGDATRKVHVTTDVFEFDSAQNGPGSLVAHFPAKEIGLDQDGKAIISVSTIVTHPRLWGPLPSQSPNLYMAITHLYEQDRVLDTYETRFGIRSLDFDADNGLSVNGVPLRIQGVNQHHDLGALGAAFNRRAAERQLEVLQELGVNAIRTAHNPPAPELLDLTDRLGFLVIDEIFDTWTLNKTDSDFHLIFPDWREPDLRAFMRRDRNHPSVIVWSYGNEVGEQESMDEEAAAISSYLREIVTHEDPTRPSTASIHRAAPNSSFAEVLDLINLNYLGEGVRYGPAYEHLEGTRRTPQYEPFHEALPDKLILGSEVAWSLSSRGSFLFPVTNQTSAPVNDTFGGNSSSLEISAYELYSADAGSSPDRVFATQDEHPFVAGGFVWAGWDYLGEPYPYEARSAYSGIIDLAGFKKERFYLYQSRWRPDLPVAHIIPHWTWPQRLGQITPVHVFTSGDEAELFLNGVSQGRQRRELLTYRFRWDTVVYEPGELHVVVYKDGQQWATDTVRTAGQATGLHLKADHTHLAPDGEDLAFVTLEVIDANGNAVPEADNLITFSVSGPGEIIATDNGFPADFTPFLSSERRAFNGLALCIVRAKVGALGDFTVTAKSGALKPAQVTLASRL
ncbi:glycoside hydrolase superfamily [Aspergillus undulatus]|uniref:glycoside hydrolase superfamily n=1 Tax=Aspergillus undulatus TaxID=1810928 RepID=UPI003CCDECCA